MGTRTPTPNPRPAQAAAPPPTPGLAGEIHKSGPFASPAQEAYLNLVRTFAVLSQDFDRLFRRHGLSGSTYNLLRILRGSGGAGRTCGEIRDHMVWRVPDVTRLADNLVRRGLASRVRGEGDKRTVRLFITPKGLRVLARLDKTVLDLHEAQLGHMPSADLASLSGLLHAARKPDPET